MDILETLPMEVDDGDMQTKPATAGKLQHLPDLAGPPEGLSEVLVDLEKNPLGDIDPTAQYKNPFKAAIKAMKEAKKGHCLFDNFVSKLIFCSSQYVHTCMMPAV